MAEKIHIFEVGPRDGLQNEKRQVPTALKLKWIQNLIEAGVMNFELGAFVRPDLVPQMADTEKLYAAVRARKLKLGKAQPWALVPNAQGLQRAAQAGVKNIAVFTAATDGFNRANIGLSVRESLDGIREVTKKARSLRMRVRGYVSTAFGCPFEGRVAPKKALAVIEQLADFGVEQVSIGDTIGVATLQAVDAVIRPSLLLLGGARVAVHFHDTRGVALANTLRSIDLGVRTVDAAAGGLGGCPFAPGAKGNLATEDLIFLLEGMGMKTGIDLDELCLADLKFMKAMKREISSRYLKAFESAGGHWPETIKKTRKKRV